MKKKREINPLKNLMIKSSGEAMPSERVRIQRTKAFNAADNLPLEKQRKLVMINKCLHHCKPYSHRRSRIKRHSYAWRK